MKKIFLIVALSSILSTPTLAQHRAGHMGGHGGNHFGGSRGFHGDGGRHGRGLGPSIGLGLGLGILGAGAAYGAYEYNYSRPYYYDRGYGRCPWGYFLAEDMLCYPD